MPGEAREEERSSARWEPQRAWAASLIALGLLLFTWPFVRTPPLPIGQAYAHLLGAWLLVIAALGVMARSLRRPPRGRGGRGG